MNLNHRLQINGVFSGFSTLPHALFDLNTFFWFDPAELSLDNAKKKKTIGEGKKGGVSMPFDSIFSNLEGPENGNWAEWCFSKFLMIWISRAANCVGVEMESKYDFISSTFRNPQTHPTRKQIPNEARPATAENGGKNNTRNIIVQLITLTTKNRSNRKKKREPGWFGAEASNAAISVLLYTYLHTYSQWTKVSPINRGFRVFAFLLHQPTYFTPIQSTCYELL